LNKCLGNQEQHVNLTGNQEQHVNLTYRI
jgi:hypothetical protein